MAKTPRKKRRPVKGPGGGTVTAAERLIKEVATGAGGWAQTPVPDPPQPALPATLKRDGSGQIYWHQ